MKYFTKTLEWESTVLMFEYIQLVTIPSKEIDLVFMF